MYKNITGTLSYGAADIQLYPVSVKTQGGDKLELQVSGFTLNLKQEYHLISSHYQI